MRAVAITLNSCHVEVLEIFCASLDAKLGPQQTALSSTSLLFVHIITSRERQQYPYSLRRESGYKICFSAYLHGTLNHDLALESCIGPVFIARTCPDLLI